MLLELDALFSYNRMPLVVEVGLKPLVVFQLLLAIYQR